jgi:hypothetical protein
LLYQKRSSVLKNSFALSSASELVHIQTSR